MMHLTSMTRDIADVDSEIIVHASNNLKEKTVVTQGHSKLSKKVTYLLLSGN